MATSILAGHITRAIEALTGPNGAQVVTETRARTITEQLAHRAYQSGRDAAIRELRTTDDVMSATGRTRRWVIELARRHNLGWRIGREWLFRDSDIEAMREIIAASRPGPKPRGE
jgi:ribosomal 50S subunit-associated protein YjgA (DUF615 family)